MTRAALPQAGGSDGAKRLVPEGDSNLPAWTKGSFGGRFIVRCKNLANTVISFPDLPRGKRNANEYCPAALDLIQPKGEVRSFPLCKRCSLFLLLVQKKEAKKKTLRRGRFRFLPLLRTSLFETTKRGLRAPFGIPRERLRVHGRSRFPVISVLRPFGGVRVNIFPDLAVVLLAPDHVLVVGALPERGAASFVRKAFHCRYQRS